MKISIVLLSTLLVLCVFLPFLLFKYKGSKNNSTIKKQVDTLLKNSGIVYSVQDFWRKNFIAISADSKLITYMQLNASGANTTTDINLTDVKACNIIKNYNNAGNKSVSLKSLALEFVYKSSNKPNFVISFFDIDEDLTEDFELQRIEKWHALIKSALIVPQQVKVAS